MLSYIHCLVLSGLSSVTSYCPPCKSIKDCSTSYLGSYNLMEENSASCPELNGFTGCLYRKNGSTETFCFKSGPLEQCHSYNKETCAGGAESDDDEKTKFLTNSYISPFTTTPRPSHVNPSTTKGINAPELPEIDGDEKEDVGVKGVVTVRPCLADKFPNLADLSESEASSLCCKESDCQEHAGCFQDELSDTFKTYCQCYLGYYLDNSTSSLPMTGDCRAMKDCSDTYTCYENDDYKLCPYCQVLDKAGTQDSIIGWYNSGEGVFDSDPMVFLGSSSDCQEEYVGIFWYCWYDAVQDVVDANQYYILVENMEECEHWAYIYTPLACPFAMET